MTIIDRIRDRLSARHADARAKYWATVAKIADGMSDRAADSAADALADLLPQLQKTPDDIEADVALLRELCAADSRSADLADAESAARQVAATAGQAMNEADALRKRAQQLVEAAEAQRSVAASRAGAAKQARHEARDIRRKLSARGWPQPAVDAPTEVSA